jgi:hypothetical protein
MNFSPKSVNHRFITYSDSEAETLVVFKNYGYSNPIPFPHFANLFDCTKPMLTPEGCKKSCESNFLNNI